VSTAALRQRILADTAFEPAGALLPDIRLHLATTPRDILREAIADRVNRREPPYWAFAWPGGQALARHILDHPELVRGKHVADIGAGSGLAAIAAMMVGARSSVANDTDPLACVAAELNAAGNGVAVVVDGTDILDRQPDADLIIIGDLVYEPALEMRVTALLSKAQRAGIPVLFGDRATCRLPALPFRKIAEFDTIVAPPLEEGYVEIARVMMLDPE
jgi:predicted nicotinamide N-methyase